MKPTLLEVEGFTSFRARSIVDFTKLDLFCITGQTGAGKTSLTDAICFALYGDTPRGNRAAELLSQGAAAMRVRLDFEHGRQSFRIVRTAKLKGNGNAYLSLVENGKETPLTNKATEVSARVTSVIGLDFDGFTKTVLLPQGKFDQFLRGVERASRPAERNPPFNAACEPTEEAEPASRPEG